MALGIERAFLDEIDDFCGSTDTGQDAIPTPQLQVLQSTTILGLEQERILFGNCLKTLASLRLNCQKIITELLSDKTTVEKARAKEEDLIELDQIYDHMIQLQPALVSGKSTPRLEKQLSLYSGVVDAYAVYSSRDSQAISHLSPSFTKDEQDAMLEQLHQAFTNTSHAARSYVEKADKSHHFDRRQREATLRDLGERFDQCAETFQEIMRAFTQTSQNGGLVTARIESKMLLLFHNCREFVQRFAAVE